MYIHILVPISANKLSQTMKINSCNNEVMKIIRSMIFLTFNPYP